MKVVQLNVTCGIGSTGKICTAVSKLLTERGNENYVLYTQGSSDFLVGVKYMTGRYKKLQALKSRVLGNYGFNSKHATNALIQRLEEFQPDVVHIHNIHGHDCNLSMLFRYFKRRNIKLFWTFHDCWAFTGYCPHFDMCGCDKWKKSCMRCAQARQFSWFSDRSQTMYRRKKELFSNLDLTIITPSQWLSDLVKESFLRDYPVKLIHNGIDLNVFKPTSSDFRARYHCEDKFVLLGVAFGWGVRKGLDVFVELARRLDDRFKIVLVGTDERIDKMLPENVISIRRTQNQVELAEIYSASDLFINPTREENYPSVNMESIACGTPVVTFRTGGSPEMIDKTCGSVVECEDLDALEREILRIAVDKPYSEEACLQRAKEFDMNERFKEYIYLYEKLAK